MRHPKEADVLELKKQGLSLRNIAKKTGLSTTKVFTLLKAQDTASPPDDPGTEVLPPPGTVTKSERKSDMTIKVTSKQWVEEISPWVRLVHEAAVDQIPQCKDLSLADFINEAAFFVRDFFELKPPGWATTISAPLKFSMPPEWDLPQVKAAAERLAKEMENDRKLVQPGSAGGEPERATAINGHKHIAGGGKDGAQGGS